MAVSICCPMLLVRVGPASTYNLKHSEFHLPSVLISVADIPTDAAHVAAPLLNEWPENRSELYPLSDSALFKWRVRADLVNGRLLKWNKGSA